MLWVSPRPLLPLLQHLIHCRIPHTLRAHLPHLVQHMYAHPVYTNVVESTYLTLTAAQRSVSTQGALLAKSAATVAQDTVSLHLKG